MKHVLLLRGINVGGAGKLLMADLRAVLCDLGAANVATYIQSGNAVFTGDILSAGFAIQVEDAIETQFGFRPRAMVFDAETFIRARDNFPFAAAFDAPKTGHISFMSNACAPDPEPFQALATADEHFHIGDGVFYLHAPSGIGRSKLAAKVEKLLGVPATARNLNSVNTLCDMILALP